MDKQQFLKRCSTAYDAGYITDDSIIVMRYAIEHALRGHGGQIDIAREMMEFINSMAKGRSLASFTELYKAEQFAYLLNHPCDECANDKTAWHTRYAFCNHNK